MAKHQKVKRLLLKLLLLAMVLVVLFYNPLTVRLMTLGVAVWYKLEPGKFYRLVKTESSFRCLAVSSKQAIGLGQVKESTARYVCLNHKRGMLFVPVYNLRVSALYVRYLLGRYNHNWSLALAAYNWGETNVDRKVKGMTLSQDKDYSYLFEEIPETSKFIKRILK